jgi:mono/diheme cytochrome c family protein
MVRTRAAWSMAAALVVAAAAAGVAESRTAAPITPVEGPSTLRRLGFTITGTSMGWAGHWSGPPSTVPGPANDPSRSEPPGGPFVLSGADLYRVSCRACHKPDGTGSPDQIHSVIGPVRAASFQWMSDDMRARGRHVEAAFIRQLTTANEADLRARLRQGGHYMPAFGQISDQEYVTLRPYLNQLAGLATTSGAPRTIAESPERVGELIVKGTCHICHDATQPKSLTQPTTIASGAIPSLASLTQTKTFADFGQKVRAGADVPLTDGGPRARGRMPVFDYITQAEVAAAYAYLIRYPPR